MYSISSNKSSRRSRYRSSIDKEYREYTKYSENRQEYPEIDKNNGFTYSLHQTLEFAEKNQTSVM